MINVRVPAKFMRTITLRRYAAGDYVDGLWVDGVSTDSEVQASVQPTTPNELRLLPEGDRAKRSWKILCNFELLMGNDSGVKADELIIDGTLFRISSPENYQYFGHSESVFIEATE